MSAMTSTERPLRSRLLGYRPTDVLWGWLAPLIVTAVGGFLRFWQLGRPNKLVFDETYYVKEGYSFLKYGYERRIASTNEKADALFTHGTPDVFGTNPDLVVHPPVGKWVIAVGEQIFGADSSFGWRFSIALLGTLSILMVGRAARRMFGSTLIGTIAAILLAFAGHHFVQSRIGRLYLILLFWAFAAFWSLLIDPHPSRALLSPPAAARHPTRHHRQRRQQQQHRRATLEPQRPGRRHHAKAQAHAQPLSRHLSPPRCHPPAAASGLVAYYVIPN